MYNGVKLNVAYNGTLIYTLQQVGAVCVNAALLMRTPII